MKVPSRHPLRALLLFAALCALFAACGSSATPAASTTPTAAAAPVTLNVFAAASLTESFNEIKAKYQEAHPNITLTYNFNGSQILVQQMINGAAADIFVSADQTNMKKAVDADLVANSQIFVRNKLAVIIPANNPGNITSLKDLARKGVKLVLAAPAVPVGKYSLQVLDKLSKSPDYGSSYAGNVKANVVSQEENVKAVVQKVQLGVADAGIVYKTDVTAAIADKVKFIEIPDQFNVIAEYPIAVTKKAPHPAEAQAFVQYLLSPEGQAIMSKYRFISPTGSGA